MIEESLPDLMRAVAQYVYQKKGFNILIMDVRGVCDLTDYLLIADGNVERHVKALADTLLEYLEEKGRKPFYVDGMSSAEWVVLDYLDFVVHLFTPQMHERYRLEEVWKEGKIVEVDLEGSDLLEPKRHLS